MRSLIRSSFPLLLIITACDEKKPVAPPPVAPAPPPVASAPPPMAEAGPPKKLPFTITKVYAGQSVTESSPWHAAGGAWTFFDAKTDSGASFVVGVPVPTAHQGKEQAQDIGAGQVLIGAGSSEAGHAFVAELAKAWSVAAPVTGDAKTKSALLHVPSSVLVKNAMRTEQGDFGGVGGGWTSTRWTLGPEDSSSEMDFSYNLTENKGEFSERRRDDDAGALKALAKALSP